MDFYALDFRYSLGHAKHFGGFAGINGLAWESYFVYLEFGFRLFDVDCMVGTKSPLL